MSEGLAKTNGSIEPLEIGRLLSGKRLVVVGGTGFLGKVWWSFLLSRYPDIGHIYLTLRVKGGKDAQRRYDEEVATSEVLDALRGQYGHGFPDFLREKVTPIAGDVIKPMCGLDADLRESLRGQVDVVVNVSGVVDFDPPLDEALEVNAFGVKNLVGLARDLGDLPILHTSTCYVAGSRTGHVPEADPREFPFPRAGELENSHWDPDQEIAECMDVIEQARHRSNDAFRQSNFLDDAKKNLHKRGEPARGSVLDAEVAKVKRKFVEGQLADLGMERAKFWGFPNTYTYTKSIGEQIALGSGLPCTIVRPAVVESTLKYPFPGWNEGINTSAPLIYIIRQGGLQIPGSENFLDVIPCDMVAGGLTLALAELLERRHKPVYQLGSSDSNPCTMRRFFELSGLYKRRYYQRTGKGGPVLSFLQSHFEGAMLSKEQFDSRGPHKLAQGAASIASLLRKVAIGPVAPLLEPAADAVSDFATQQRRVGNILAVFVPFVAQFEYVFRCDNTRAAFERLSPEDKERINWTPDQIDWRTWFLEVHAPGLEKWVFPNIDERLKRPKRPPEPHQTLPALLDEMAERFELSVALQRTEATGLSRLSFREWREQAGAAAARLIRQGVRPGDRVMLGGANHPAWAICFFGILMTGATVVPVDAAIEAEVAANLQRASRAQIFVCDAKVEKRVAGALSGVKFLDYHELAAKGPIGIAVAVTSDDVAALIYTSGTTGNPKGVQLSHANLSALVAALAPLFPLSKGDRVLSVLPLHHTFELTCGMLLPLSRGARIVYLDELNAERLEYALKEGKITSLIGVPALWEMLERRILARVAEHGAVAAKVFDIAVELNRSLGKSMGLDAGKLLFGSVHHAFGGKLRYLVSGSAALPERTHHLFAGLGMHMAEGYGLTEASPVLTVSAAGPRGSAGHVGKPIPGVEIRIEHPNAQGVGEILARGPNVMLGYSDNPEATAQVIDREGWLRTGDLGKLDRRGRLAIVGRAKDVIVASNGENVYPDDVEARLDRISAIKELCILGVPDGRGGERVACVAVAERDPDLAPTELRVKAQKELEQAVAKLPSAMRPALIVILDRDLPRTATRKVKRNEVRAEIERRDRAQDAVRVPGPVDGVTALVRSTVATIARRPIAQVTARQALRGDLGFDSLMLLELLVAFERELGQSLDAERVSSAVTVADVESFVREAQSARRLLTTTKDIEKEEATSLEIPEPLREAAMAWMGRAQHGFYDRVLRTKVSGRAFIPQNRSSIIAANHSSHLDMGLVKYALGSYGDRMVSLAAQDYFFEGNRYRKAFFENFTNLAPMPRGSSLRQALRQAGDLIEQGHNVLIFPEGTRSTDGQVHEFKSAVGHLALHHRVDILPVWLGGTHRALPKGATLPKHREVEARIGLPLEHGELRRLTTGLSAVEASRVATRLSHRAVVMLSQGQVLNTRDCRPEEVQESIAPPEPESLAALFRELEQRFKVGSVQEPISFYFSLGETERWTVRVTGQHCEVVAGKVSGPADCVLKTSPDMFTRIVRERYTPSPAEFMAGTVKSNNIQLLFTFQKIFQLESGAS